MCHWTGTNVTHSTGKRVLIRFQNPLITKKTNCYLRKAGRCFIERKRRSTKSEKVGVHSNTYVHSDTYVHSNTHVQYIYLWSKSQHRCWWMGGFPPPSPSPPPHPHSSLSTLLMFVLKKEITIWCLWQWLITTATLSNVSKDPKILESGFWCEYARL